MKFSVFLAKEKRICTHYSCAYSFEKYHSLIERVGYTKSEKQDSTKFEIDCQK